jgi:hypothetical protein
MPNSFKLKTGSILFIAAMAMMPTPSLAKKVKNSTAAHLLSVCMLTEDNYGGTTPNGFTRCCSWTLGYCIECERDASVKCEKIEIRTTPPKEFRDKAPDTGNLAPAAQTRKTPRPRLMQSLRLVK